MFKKISENKSKLIMFFVLAAAVVGKCLITLFDKGKPGTLIFVTTVLMSFLFVLFFFIEFPRGKKEIFKGRNLIRIIAALVVFFWSFSMYYITSEFTIAMVALPIMIFFASDIRLLPLNVIIALGLSVRFAAAGFAAVPCAVIVSLILIAPGIKEAKPWEKIVFAGAELCLIINLIYEAYKLRFIFSLNSFLHNHATTVLMIILAAFFAACIAVSLKKEKTPKGKKKANKSKKVSVNKKTDYFSVCGYFIAAVFALLWTMLEKRYVMSGLVGLLMSAFIVCRDGTAVQKITDKAASVLESVVDKFISDSPDEGVSK